MNALQKIQAELKAPKNQRNNFGKYNYRSCEDILESVKPLLEKHDATLTITDTVNTLENIPQMVIVDESTKPKTKQLVNSSLVYVESTVRITAEDVDESVSAQAGLDVNKAGMDYAQSFGSSSSYARKYALNGLFLIDDTKDADATNDHGKNGVKKPEVSKAGKTLMSFVQAKAILDNVKSMPDLKSQWESHNKRMKAELSIAEFEKILKIKDGKKSDFEAAS